MAGPFDPFTPGPTVDPTAGIPDQSTFESIRNQWATWLDQPGNRQFLLQTGVALMQPRRWGDTPMSQIGRSIGEGAEAATRAEAIQASLGLTGAKTEALRARTGGLGLQAMRQKYLEQRESSMADARLRKAYEDEKRLVQSDEKERVRRWEAEAKLWEKAEERRGMEGPKFVNPYGPSPPPKPSVAPKLTYEEWLKTAGPQRAMSMGALAAAPVVKPPSQQQAEPETGEED